jgi:hypothetical protein
MILHSQPADPAIHHAACIVARRRRFIVRAVLGEEESADAQLEFDLVARDELEELLSGNLFTTSTPSTETT